MDEELTGLRNPYVLVSNVATTALFVFAVNLTSLKSKAATKVS